MRNRKISIYADGADYEGIMKAAKNPNITGFTTNPTLMKQAGIDDYEVFAKNIIYDLSQLRPGTNISLEVFADDTETMYAQAKKIASWGEEANYDVFVKIPVINTHGESNAELIGRLNAEGVKVNVTAVFTAKQTEHVIERISNPDTPVIISIFAGRIADTLVDPVRIVRDCVDEVMYLPLEFDKVKFLWASCREQYHLVMAEQAGCDIITMLHSQIDKLNLEGRDLEGFSRETVQMFFDDAKASGYTL